MAIQTKLSKEEVEKLTKEIEESRASFEAAKDTIQKTAESKLIDMQYSKKLSEELGTLVDANGKVIAGNEKRVDYILGELSSALGEEYKRNGNLIEINGQVVKSYEKLQKSIQDTIKEKELEIKKDAILELSKQTTKRQLELEVQRKKVYQQLKVAVEDYDNAVENGMNKWTTLWSPKQREIEKNVVNLKKEYDNLGNEIEQVSKEATLYTDLMTDSIVQSLIEQSQAVEDLGSDQIAQWQELAREDRAKFNEAIQLIPDDARQKVLATTNAISKAADESKPQLRLKIDEIANIIKGLGPDFKLTPKIDINPNVALKVSDLKTKLQKLADSLTGLTNKGLLGTAITSTINTAINKLNALGYAAGGFPEMGQLFMAREAGPELVGSIGNRNAVVNNDQIVEAVSTGVANAVASVLGNGGSSYQLIIDGEQITDVVQRRLARRANITGMAMGV